MLRDRPDAVKILATALDNLGSRFHRDLHPESSYLPMDDPKVMADAIDRFAGYVEEQLAVLDDPVVKAALAEVRR